MSVVTWPMLVESRLSKKTLYHYTTIMVHNKAMEVANGLTKANGGLQA